MKPVKLIHFIVIDGEVYEVGYEMIDPNSLTFDPSSYDGGCFYFNRSDGSKGYCFNQGANDFWRLEII